MGLNGAQIIDGRTRDDMLDNARGYINNLLDRT